MVSYTELVHTEVSEEKLTNYYQNNPKKCLIPIQYTSSSLIKIFLSSYKKGDILKDQPAKNVQKHQFFTFNPI